MSTFEKLAKDVANAKETAAWQHGATGQSLHATGELKGIFERTKAKLGGDTVPLNCVWQKPQEGRTSIIGKHVFVVRTDDTVAYGFDASLAAGGEEELVTFDIFGERLTDTSDFDWFLRCDGVKLNKVPFSRGEAPGRLNHDMVADAIVSQLSRKLIAKASSL